ncbi:MAG: inositol monophosphatase [Gemmatimonadota bacterium]|nr:MAG: inositol monophosphatase [Gemmatimonadota bacterium]
MLKFTVDVAIRTGHILLNHFQRGLDVRYKSSEIDLVTEADLASERFIVETIRHHYPKHGILSEEEVEDKEDREFFWIIDPLDGTVNYAHGFPIFCVSLALQQRGDPILGVTHDPMRDETFTAVKNLGAFLNGDALKVSGADRLVRSLVATGFPYKRATIEDNNLPEFNRVLPKVQGVRRGGSAALDLAYVAAGRLDGYWEAHLSPWDWAAGVLMIQEAGGRVTDRRNQPWTFGSKKMVATNGLIHEELLHILNEW